METVTMSISNQWLQNCLPGLPHKARRVTAALEILDFICLAKRFLSLTNGYEKRAVTVPGAKGSELSTESYWAEKHNSAPLPCDKIHWKGSEVAEVKNKAMEHLQICQHQAGGWWKSLPSSMDSLQRPVRASVVWLPSKGRMTNVSLLHWISQHQPLAWKAPK